MAEFKNILSRVRDVKLASYSPGGCGRTGRGEFPWSLRLHRRFVCGWVFSTASNAKGFRWARKESAGKLQKQGALLGDKFGPRRDQLSIECFATADG